MPVQMPREAMLIMLPLIIDVIIACTTSLLSCIGVTLSEAQRFSLQKLSIIAEQAAEILMPWVDNHIIDCAHGCLLQLSIWLSYIGTPNWYKIGSITQFIVNRVGRPISTDVHVAFVRFLIEALGYNRAGVIRLTRNLQRMLYMYSTQQPICKSVSQHTAPLSVSSLDRLIQRHNLMTNNWTSHQFISDEELKFVLIWLRFESGFLSYGQGVRSIRGYLRSIGIFVSRTRIQRIMQQIDAAGVEYRRREIIERSVYNVSGPLEMFHADANCKLVNWRIYIHGCIDGFSHYIVYCKATGEKMIQQLLHQFLKMLVNK